MAGQWFTAVGSCCVLVMTAMCAVMLWLTMDTSRRNRDPPVLTPIHEAVDPSDAEHVAVAIQNTQGAQGTPEGVPTAAPALETLAPHEPVDPPHPPPGDVSGAGDRAGLLSTPLRARRPICNRS